MMHGVSFNINDKIHVCRMNEVVTCSILESLMKETSVNCIVFVALDGQEC